MTVAQLPLWVEYVKALGAPIVAFIAACIAGGIAYQQWITARNKLKLDLYNRRFKIYEDVLTLYQSTWVEPWDSDKVRALERALIRSLRESKFLFAKDDGIFDAITKINQAIFKVSSFKRYKIDSPEDVDVLVPLQKSSSAAFEELMTLMPELEELLAKYLDFRKVNG